MITGRMEPKTEAHPLIDHAQGIRSGFKLSVSLIPKGKGIPMRKQRGAIDIDEINPRKNSSSPRYTRNRLGRIAK